MHKKVLLIMFVSTMLFFAASAENTCDWNGWWHADVWGNIHFQSTPSGQSTATFDGYDKFGSGDFKGSIMDHAEGNNCLFKGTWTSKTDGQSGEIELIMRPDDHVITGSYTHAPGKTWSGFPLAKPEKV
jgi:hypothetical protein